MLKEYSQPLLIIAAYFGSVHQMLKEVSSLWKSKKQLSCTYLAIILSLKLQCLKKKSTRRFIGCLTKFLACLQVITHGWARKVIVNNVATLGGGQGQTYRRNMIPLTKMHVMYTGSLCWHSDVSPGVLYFCIWISHPNQKVSLCTYLLFVAVGGWMLIFPLCIEFLLLNQQLSGPCFFHTGLPLHSDPLPTCCWFCTWHWDTDSRRLALFLKAWYPHLTGQGKCMYSCGNLATLKIE